MSGLSELLPEEVVTEIRQRAGGYDRENAFFLEDFQALRATGYLTAPLPTELGGAGLGIAELSLGQRMLAAHAPATALGVNMHLLWLAVARALQDRGDDRLGWVLEEAAAGEVFAFGISEAGNESVLLDSTSHAAPAPDGEGYRVTGTKIFTTLSPVWTRLGLHARVDGADPKIVVGFVRREAPAAGALFTHEEGSEGISHPGTWNPLGMRATQSWNTHLSEVPLLPRELVAEYDPFDPSDPIILAVSACFGILTSSVYAGIADRAIELATRAVNQPLGDGIGLDDPDVASRLTEAVLDHRASVDMLELLAADHDAGTPRDDWPIAIGALKNRVTDEARRTVETALRIVGSRAYDADHELARLYRDVLAGMFHPRSSRSLAAGIRSALTTQPL